MAKTWDGGDIAFQPSTWAAIAEHLLPGAFGMAFASSRGWHRLAMAIEDAGLIIHPSIFGWAYGSGFPKATRIKDRPDFEGHRYGLQALKPALEPIIVFQKTYEGRPVECITETGAGALWIEGGRIGLDGTEDLDAVQDGNIYGSGDIYGKANQHHTTPTYKPSGRWPANFVLDVAPAERLDELSGELGLSKKGSNNIQSRMSPSTIVRRSPNRLWAGSAPPFPESSNAQGESSCPLPGRFLSSSVGPSTSGVSKASWLMGSNVLQ